MKKVKPKVKEIRSMLHDISVMGRKHIVEPYKEELKKIPNDGRIESFQRIFEAEKKARTSYHKLALNNPDYTKKYSETKLNELIDLADKRIKELSEEQHDQA